MEHEKNSTLQTVKYMVKNPNFTLIIKYKNGWKPKPYKVYSNHARYAYVNIFLYKS